MALKQQLNSVKEKKRDVLRFLSASTWRNNNNKTAVTTTAQPNKANLCIIVQGLSCKRKGQRIALHQLEVYITT